MIHAGNSNQHIPSEATMRRMRGLFKVPPEVTIGNEVSITRFMREYETLVEYFLATARYAKTPGQVIDFTPMWNSDLALKTSISLLESFNHAKRDFKQWYLTSTMHQKSDTMVLADMLHLGRAASYNPILSDRTVESIRSQWPITIPDEYTYASVKEGVVHFDKSRLTLAGKKFVEDHFLDALDQSLLALGFTQSVKRSSGWASVDRNPEVLSAACTIASHFTGHVSDSHDAHVSTKAHGTGISATGIDVLPTSTAYRDISLAFERFLRHFHGPIPTPRITAAHTTAPEGPLVAANDTARAQ